MNRSTKIFESHRQALFRIAYGMLGRVAPAEDAVQETYIRWEKQDLDKINSPKAFLSTILSRICLDEIKSARNRKEEYIGPDLPEPLLTSDLQSPQDELELSQSLSMAMLFVMDQLTPVQRAVYILREIFDYDYASIAEIIQKSESYCRKIAQRARDQIKNNKPQFEKESSGQHELISTFIETVQGGEISKIEKMLAEEAILYSDGGGKVTAARKPIYGSNKIARFLVGIQKSATANGNLRAEFKNINGEPGMILWIDKQLYNAWSFHVENNKIQRIFVILNPEKLEHLKK